MKTIFVLYARQFDGSGAPEILRAYMTREMAERDRDMIRRAGSSMDLFVSEVEWC